MTTEQLAEKLNNCEYDSEVSDEISQIGKENHLVIVFGYSDDNMEFRGAIDDEVGAYTGGEAFVNKDGLVTNECDEEDCPYYKKALDNASKIEALWCETDEYSWTYKTSIPHETFDVLEDGKKFCKGIIFDLKKLS